MGRIGRRGTGPQISRLGPGARSCLWVLLSNCATRCCRDGRALSAAHQRHLSHTLSPLISRAICPLMMAKIFGPRSVPKKFEVCPKEMALRPSQIRASAAESSLMIPDAFKSRNQYADLQMPVVIIAGEQDRLVDIDTQSARLHSDISQSGFHRLPGNGHMIQQTATDQVMSAIREVAIRPSKFEAAE
jgi:pimeloyl-ACP methyl ester carboxylesterase